MNNKRLCAAAVSLAAAVLMNATDYKLPEGMKTVSVHPANADGKLMTMEDAIWSSKTRAASFNAAWYGNHTYVYIKDGKPQLADADKGIDIDMDPVRGAFGPQAGAGLRDALPEGAENVTAAPGEAEALAFTSGNSLYYIDKMKHVYPVALSEGAGIVYGQTVSRNEFGISGGIFWAPDGRKLAFYRKDESKVTEFPLLDINTRTGSLKSIRYPMNGMESENIRLGIYNLAENTTVYVQADDFGYDQYLTNVTWSPDGRHIFIQMLDRAQKHMHLNMYRTSDGRFEKTVLTEENDRWVEPMNPLHWFGQTGKFIYTTDNRDGYKSLYLCDTLGNVDRLTKAAADVKFVAAAGEKVFYLSSEVSPAEQHLFCVPVSVSRKGAIKVGTPSRLTADEGWHNVRVNADGTWFLDSYSSMNVPTEVKLRSVDGRTCRTLFSAEDPLKDYVTGDVVLGTVKSADGKYDNSFRLLLPAGFDPEKKYPVILYVYGGPHSQLVDNSWLGQTRLWEMYMAERGYIVYVQDNRGTESHGTEYEKSIHKFCGKVEMEDQMAGLRQLMSMPYVDKERIGVHGWSYGGFMTISLMLNHPDVFKTGVAGGPVIDWKWYEVMYGERYMETQETNPEGFAETSLIGKAKDLKGKLLICHGAVDNTVVWEHSLSFIRECVKNLVQVDYFPYPCAEHNVRGHDRIHLMDKVTLYFEDYL